MELLKIINWGSIVVTLIPIVIGWKKLDGWRVKFFYVASLMFFYSSLVLFGGGEGINTWLKHGLFYVAQFLFFMYLSTYINQYLSRQKELETPSALSTPLILGVLTGTSGERDRFFSFITNEGLQHILTFPILLILLTYIRIKSIYIQSDSIISFLYYSAYGMGIITLMHTFEFLVENQHLIPWLDGEPMEFLETFLYLLGMVVIGMSFKKIQAELKL